MVDRKSYIYNGLAVVSGFDVILRAARHLTIPLKLTYNILRRGIGTQGFNRTRISDGANDKANTTSSLIPELTDAERKLLLSHLRTEFFMWFLVVLVPLISISININQKSQLWFGLPIIAVLVKTGFHAYSVRNNLFCPPGGERRAALWKWILNPGEWVP